MKPEVKHLLLQELYSGQRQQASEALKEVRSDGSCAFCTLGILIDLGMNAGLPLKWGPESTSPTDPRQVPYQQGTLHRTTSDRLPPEVAQWAEVSETPRISLSHLSPHTLELLNDHLLTLHHASAGEFQPVTPDEEMFIHDLNDMGIPFPLQACILNEVL